MARESLGKAAERRKRGYDLRVREKEFHEGQWVWYFYPRRVKGRSPKWQRLYTGPYLIVKELPPVNFVIQRSKNGIPKVVHADKLKLWGGEPLPSWLEEVQDKDAKKELVAEPVPTGPNETGKRQAKRKSKEPVVPEISKAQFDDSDDRAPEATRPARARKPPRNLADYVH